MDQLLIDFDKTIKERKLTRKQVAAELGYSETTISRWFNGKHDPRSEAVRKKLMEWINNPNSGAYVVIVLNGVRYAGTLYPQYDGDN